MITPSSTRLTLFANTLFINFAASILFHPLAHLMLLAICDSEKILYEFHQENYYAYPFTIFLIHTLWLWRD